MSGYFDMKPEIKYAVRLEPEDTPVRGNAMASGDPNVDRDTEAWTLSELDRGNLGAWCVAIVTATLEIDGRTFKGEAALGCCSYASEEECIRDMLSDEYGLKSDARDHLETKLHLMVKSGELAKRALKALE